MTDMVLRLNSTVNVGFIASMIVRKEEFVYIKAMLMFVIVIVKSQLITT